MKFTCLKEELLDAVNNCIKAVSSKASMPSLECFQIIADEQITLCAHDLATGIKSTFDANIYENGSLLINAKLFSDILRKLPDDEINFTTTDDYSVQISCQKSVFDFTSLDDSEFPLFPIISKLNYVTVNGLTLKNMINQTKFAKSDNESKLIHTGFLFEVSDNFLKLVTVDGYRLALRKEKIDFCSVDKMHFVVPGNAIIELEKIIREDKDVTIYLDDKTIIFEIENIVLTTRIIEGDFLDYDKSLPLEFSSIIKVSTPDLKRSIDRVSLVISERTRTPVRFKFEEQTLKLTCITTLGKSYDEYIFEGDAEQFEIGFNNKYILDALTAVPKDKCNLKFSGSLSPLIVAPCDDNDDFLYLILPVRLKTDD